jgi:hypothetical protein
MHRVMMLSVARSMLVLAATNAATGFCPPPLPCQLSRSRTGLSFHCELQMASSTMWANGRQIDTVATHAKRLRERGFTVLPEAVVDTALIQRAQAKCQSTLAQLLRDLEAKGCDPLEQSYEFREISTRQRNRWDLQLQVPGKGDGSSVWDQLCTEALEVVTPIISQSQGRASTGSAPIMIGAVVSRPGARVQRFHCDADSLHLQTANIDPSHRLYNVFIPLVDIQEDGDGTEFWGAPHLQGQLDELVHHFHSSGEHKDLSVGADQIKSPACSAGGIIIYDYRTLHRGLPNPAAGRERPVAYVIVATGGAGQFRVICKRALICHPS